MPCLHPVKTVKNITRKIGINYSKTRDYITYPCGQCKECLIRKKSEWNLRAHLEYITHEHNNVNFVTLTIRDEFLTFSPSHYKSINKKEFNLFLKRLRKIVGSFRYFAVGEYTPKNQRPHWHFVIYGIPYQNLHNAIYQAWSVENSKSPKLYDKNIDYALTQSPFNHKNKVAVPLEKYLTKTRTCMGRFEVDPYSSAMAGYVAQYITQKMDSKPINDDREPECFLRSSKPGLGRDGITLLAQHMKNNNIAINDYPSTGNQYSTWIDMPHFLPTEMDNKIISYDDEFGNIKSKRKKQMLSVDTYIKEKLILDLGGMLKTSDQKLDNRASNRIEHMDDIWNGEDYTFLEEAKQAQAKIRSERIWKRFSKKTLQ